MSIWRDKVQTAMHSIVLDVSSIDPTLVSEELLKLLVNIRGGCTPTLFRVYRIPESRCVYNSQSQFDALLLNLHRLLLYPGRLLDPLLYTGYDTVLVEIAQEQAVDECRFAQASLAHDHQGEVESSFHRLAVHLFGQGGKPNVVPILLRRVHRIRLIPIGFPEFSSAPTAIHTPPAEVVN